MKCHCEPCKRPKVLLGEERDSSPVIARGPERSEGTVKQSQEDRIE